MMKKYSAWNAPKAYFTGTPRRSTLLLLVLVAFCLQGCFGIGGSSSSSNTPSTKTITTNANGQQVGVNQTQNLFKGKIYFTIDHNLWVIDPTNNSRQITNGGNLYDPAISPNGKWIAFIARYKDFSNLIYTSITGGSPHILRNGSGKFFNVGGFVHNRYQWYAQPTWSADGSRLIFLSDLQKNYDWSALGHPFDNAPFLDL